MATKTDILKVVFFGLTISFCAAAAWGDIIQNSVSYGPSPWEILFEAMEPSLDSYPIEEAPATGENYASELLPEQRTLYVSEWGTDEDQDGFVEREDLEANPTGYVVLHFLSSKGNVRVVLDQGVDDPLPETLPFMESEAVIPEPAMVVLLLAGGGLVLVHRRRRTT